MPQKRPSSLQDRPRGCLKGRKARRPARGLENPDGPPSLTWQRVWSDLTAHRNPHPASYPAAVWAPAGQPWPRSRHFRHSNGPPMAGSDGGNQLGPASAEAAGKAAPCPAPAYLQPSARAAASKLSPTHVHARAVLRNWPLSLSTAGPLSLALWCCVSGSQAGRVPNLKKDVWNQRKTWIRKYSSHTLTPRHLFIFIIYTSIFFHVVSFKNFLRSTKCTLYFFPSFSIPTVSC